MRRARLCALAAAGLAAALLSSCGSGDRILDAVDPEAVPLAPAYEDVKAIVDRRCLVCHRDGDEEEAEDPSYSSCQGIVAGAGGILSTAVDGGSMPPGALPRLTEREKLIIRRWIQQGTCAPCNPCP